MGSEIPHAFARALGLPGSAGRRGEAVALWLRPASVSSTKHEWVGSSLMGWRWLASGFRAHSVTRIGFRAVLIILLLLWGTGLVLFLRSPRIASVTLPSFAPHPTDEHNLAAAIYGPHRSC
jgi:hypothetical protein